MKYNGTSCQIIHIIIFYNIYHLIYKDHKNSNGAKQKCYASISLEVKTLNIITVKISRKYGEAGIMMGQNQAYQNNHCIVIADKSKPNN